MPGSITLTTPGYRPALVGSPSPGTSLLASLAGKARMMSDTGGPGTVSQMAQTRPARWVTPASTEPQVKQDIAQFVRAVELANTPAQLLANAVALRVLLTANGLADQAGNPALACRALLSNPARANSLLNQLKDSRWYTVNTLYSFATRGLTTLRNPDTIAAISRAYTAARGVAGLETPRPSVAPNFPGLPRRRKSAKALLRVADQE
jgi:uncharacterized protein DUF1217